MPPHAPETRSMPSPARLTDHAFAFQRTAAVRAAVGLDLFTAICEGCVTAPELAERCKAAERGVRVLCNYLVTLDLLSKEDDHYGVAPDAEVFLNRGSPAFIGEALDFVASDAQLQAALSDPAAMVRSGGSVLDGATQLVAPDHADWTLYARSMAPLMARSASLLADLVAAGGTRAKHVLDVAAGPGQNGIELATRMPEVRITALDWPSVLAVARQNAQAARVGDRWQELQGSALEVPLGGPYDVVLVVRFLHLLPPSDCHGFLRRVHAALTPQGRIVTLDTTLNDDHVSPPFAAMMNFNVLATTPGGQIYSTAELETLLHWAGFARLDWHPLTDSDERVLIGWKEP